MLSQFSLICNIFVVSERKTYLYVLKEKLVASKILIFILKSNLESLSLH